MTKPISIIVARDKQGVIGYRTKIPWRLKEDMRLFRENTKRQNVIMGRKTWDSLPNKPLPIRRNIVVSKTLPKAKNAEYILARSFQAALFAAENIPGKTMVIGGSQIYVQALPLADEIILTDVDADIYGDIDEMDFFPDLNENDWEEVSKSTFAADIDNQFDFTHRVLKRK